jgi:hypothetical protein
MNERFLQLRARVALLLVAMLVVTTVALGMQSPSPANATNQWASWHWPQNPGGGYPRWVPYHDHTNASVFPSGIGFNHNAAHYYSANNNWYPYQVCNTCYNRIDGLSGQYYAIWYGITEIISYSGNHFDFVQIRFDEIDPPSTDNGKHAVFCHEIGHSGGLDHRASGSGSCMVTDAFQPDFDSHDTSLIYNIHNHTD